MTRVVSIPAVVVLPAPLGPSKPKISPRRTDRSSLSTASVPPGYSLESCSVRMTSSLGLIAAIFAPGTRGTHSRFRRRPFVTHLLDVHERGAQLVDPVTFVIAHQPHAPCEGVAPTAGDTRVDERVEHAPFVHAQTGHHRHAEVGEELLHVAAPRAPRHLAAEARLRLV